MLKKHSLIVASIIFVTFVVGGIFISMDDLQGHFGPKLSPLLSPFSRVELPDLVVQDIYLDDDVLTAKIGNEGKKDVFTAGPTPSGHTYVYIDGALEWTYSWTTLSDVSFLFKGDSSLLQPQTLELGHWVEVCVDTKDIVTESNESNNCLNVLIDEEVTRGSIVADMMDDAGYALDSCTGSIFSDLDASDDYCAAVETAYNDGFILAAPDDLFHGGDNIKRAEGARVAYSIYGLTLSGATSATFPDVSTSSWYFPYVETLNDYGAADPDSSGLFRPSDSLMQSELDHWMDKLP